MFDALLSSAHNGEVFSTCTVTEEPNLFDKSNESLQVEEINPSHNLKYDDGASDFGFRAGWDVIRANRGRTETSLSIFG